jgi:hypothetical protein
VLYWLQKYNIPRRNRGGRSHSVNLKGKRFGKYTVLHQTKGNGHCAIWTCQCDCGTIKDIKGPMLRKREVKSCGLCETEYRKKSSRKRGRWTGCGEISGQFWSSIKNNARVRGLEFSITIEQAWEKFLQQQGKCALSGIALSTMQSYNSTTKRTASLDRIDSNKGYTIDNVEWIHKDLQAVKRNIPKKDFVKWCRLIVKHNKNV